MFISRNTWALLEEVNTLKEQNAALLAENKQLGERLEALRQAEQQRLAEEKRTARQFENLFAYTGRQQEEAENGN